MEHMAGCGNANGWRAEEFEGCGREVAQHGTGEGVEHLEGICCGAADTCAVGGWGCDAHGTQETVDGMGEVAGDGECSEGAAEAAVRSTVSDVQSEAGGSMEHMVQCGTGDEGAGGEAEARADAHAAAPCGSSMEHMVQCGTRDEGAGREAVWGTDADEAAGTGKGMEHVARGGS